MTIFVLILNSTLDKNGLGTGESSEVDIAVVIDDVINHPPQFLQKR